jgi:hypothetical protein
MTSENAIAREALFAIRAELDRRGLPLKVLAGKAGVSASTFMSWFPVPGGSRDPQIPSLACLPALARALPGDLLSYLVPDGFHIVPDPTGGLDYDEIAAACLEVASVHAKARHPASPGGVEIVESEARQLGATVVMLPLRGKVAA